jgi:hypothetical protein
VTRIAPGTDKAKGGAFAGGLARTFGLRSAPLGTDCRGKALGATGTGIGR